MVDLAKRCLTPVQGRVYEVNGKDVKRGLSRARTLQSAGVNVVGIVMGEDWVNLEARELAKERGIWWIVGGIPSDGFIPFRYLSPESEGGKG